MDPARKVLPALSLFVFVLAGCGGGSSGTNTTPPPPASPTFTSTPVNSASEGAPYSYSLTATSPNSSSITFSLTTAPSGATLSGDTVSWTPTHAQSRVANSFVVAATTAAGGSATQSWTVTPTGTVNITAVITYWTPSGSTNVPFQWLANVPYPSALVPQANGSPQLLLGAANADGSFSIPNVPAGYYWLQVAPRANYWTSASDFDFGQDVVGRPLATTSQSTTTTVAGSVSGIVPSTASNQFFTLQTDLSGLSLFPFTTSVPPNTTALGFSNSVTTNLDWSKITTLYISQYENSTSGNFTGYILGPSQTLSNIALVNGATNSINATLSPSPVTSLPLSITGTAWAALAPSVGPGAPAAVSSDYAVFAQPYVSDRFASPTSSWLLGPDLTLLRPAQASLSPYACGLSVERSSSNAGIAPIVSDVDYGTLSYGDPFPPTWPRMFQYCQVSAVTLPRPNSTATDTLYITNQQTTPLPSGPVTPILSSVQSPTLNGSSFFQSATLSNTTSLNVGWTPPATGQPSGYVVAVYQLVALPPNNTMTYIDVAGFGTAKTSLTIPFTLPNGTYVFTILAVSDAGANMETSPLRHKIPLAQSGVVSAPFVIQ